MDTASPATCGFRASTESVSTFRWRKRVKVFGQTAALQVAIATVAILQPIASHASGIPAAKLPDIYITGQLTPDQFAQADAASTGVVTQEQIENRPISRPAEVLEVHREVPRHPNGPHNCEAEQRRRLYLRP